MRIRSSRHRVLACLAGISVVFAAACAPEEPEERAVSDGNCAVAALDTIAEGKLTIGTDKPAYEPWFVDDDPSNGKGFESAVAYAVADEMGFDKADITWTQVRFNNAIQPGPKDFDFDINQFTITERRKEAVDFSSPYYDVQQALITLQDSKIANATSIADLRDSTLGAQVSTTSYDVIANVIKPNAEPQTFPNNTNARQSLQNGSIDGLVIDLPTAYYMVAAQLEGAKIVGQVPLRTGAPEQFGLVLDKESPLTPCVDKAVDALQRNGTLDELADRWLAKATNAPVLK